MFNSLNDRNLDGLATQKIAVVHPPAQEMHPSARGYAANNIYPGFPPLMSDGRALIAAWQPEAIENNRLLKESGVTSNWEYRKYLTHNAQSVIQKNFSEAANDCGYSDLGVKRGNTSAYLPIFAGLPKTYSTPAYYKTYTEAEMQYGKFNSDLKANYLSREQLAARVATPVISQDELLKWKKSKTQ
jgi:hypothetical protein